MKISKTTTVLVAAIFAFTTINPGSVYAAEVGPGSPACQKCIADYMAANQAEAQQRSAGLWRGPYSGGMTFAAMLAAALAANALTRPEHNRPRRTLVTAMIMAYLAAESVKTVVTSTVG
jgi:hypothetical protein